MFPGDAFSLKPVCKLINSLNFDSVSILDPHSDVTPALLDRCRVVPQVTLVSVHDDLIQFVVKNQPVIVAPDAGAAKKAFAVAQHFSLPLVTATKVRDVKTGVITNTEIRSDALRAWIP